MTGPCSARQRTAPRGDHGRRAEHPGFSAAARRRVTEGMVILDPVRVCRYGGDRSRATTDPKRQHLVLA